MSPVPPQLRRGGCVTLDRSRRARREPECHLFNPGMGHLGFGQPFANAAKLVYRDRQVVNVAVAFGCTVQEIETARATGSS